MTAEPISKISREPIRKITLQGGHTRYRVIVDVGRKDDGSRDQRCATFDTRKEARAYLSKVRTEVNVGTFVKPTKESLNGHLDSWIAGQSHRDLKPATLRCYQDALRPVRVLLGAKTLQAVTADDVDRVKAGMLDGTLRRVGTAGKPLSARSVNLTLTVLQMALEAALKRGKVHRNVASVVDRVKGSGTTVGAAWTPAQVATFRTIITDDDLHAGWLMSLYGLRRGEVLGLGWEHIDLDTGTLSVQRNRVLVAGEVTEGTPKTKNGTRTLPLPADLALALKALQQRQRTDRLAAGPAWAGTGHVVVDALGRPVHPERFSDGWDRLVKVAGVPRIRLHDARHTSVTIMRGLGHPDYLVARWHGHDEAVMRRTYTHATVEDLRGLAGLSVGAL